MGVIMDCDVSFSNHVTYICQKSCFSLKNLYLHAGALPSSLIRVKLCESLVFPIVDYCLSVYFRCLTKHGISRKTRLTAKNRFRFAFICNLNKILINKSPTELYNKIEFRHDTPCISTRNQNLIEIPMPKSEKFKSNFSYIVAHYNHSLITWLLENAITNLYLAWNCNQSIASGRDWKLCIYCTMWMNVCYMNVYV